MRLQDLIRDIPEKWIIGNPGVDIGGIAYHSANVHKGMLFVAVHGLAKDGHTFIEEALDRGAEALVVEQGQEKDYGVPVIVVSDGRAALAHLSATFFGYPSEKIRLVGVTGTNGKTTTSFLIESILEHRSLACGVVGTINYRYGDSVIPAPMTTPESYDIQKMLREMLDSGITHVVMEVSSHALDLRRVDGCHFDVGVFTNFTQDHLDYHADLDQYRHCKEHLFTAIIPAGNKRSRTAILNLDDPVGEDLWQTVSYAKIGYATQREASFWAGDVTNSLNGVGATIHTPQGRMRIESPLVGEFNIYNIMAAMGAATALGVPEDSIRHGIEAVSTVPGRMERIENEKGVEIFVDYAHTPDALETALTVLRPFRGKGRLITVFGCGGDRDRTKRPLMGRAVARLSDISIITSDNPRSERAGDIIQEIERGFVSENGRLIERGDLDRGGEAGGYFKIEDRREAISLAVQAARPGDIVLIAGKGHEGYQILGDRRLPFDDRAEVRKALLKTSSTG
jgi:UDP-N-acetylmuramoyl-L-alanyl-D-glutamate--2,6-diaminopimelate ligase